MKTLFWVFICRSEEQLVNIPRPLMTFTTFPTERDLRSLRYTKIKIKYLCFRLAETNSFQILRIFIQLNTSVALEV